MKNRDEVITLFRDKYEYLKMVYPSVGSFEETRLYQNPDGGWQMNLENCAAITLRPNDEEPHETHGQICARWYREGRAFDDAGVPGWLGYPVSDIAARQQVRWGFETNPPQHLCVPDDPLPGHLQMITEEMADFEFGTLSWSNSPSSSSAMVRLNAAGTHHVPQDIANAFEIFLAQCKVSVKTRFPCVCNLNLTNQPVWTFRANVEGYDNFSIQIWRDGPPGREGANIYVSITKSTGTEEKCKVFDVPNLFRTTR